jgi:hypothetical protein
MITIENGIATLPDGTTLNLIPLQEVVAEWAHDYGDMELGNVVYGLSLLTGVSPVREPITTTPRP